MAEIKFNISNPKTGKSYKRTIETNEFLGKQMNNTINGELLELPGYELQITGGSDNSGFPMRADIPGSKRIKALLSGGTGIHLKMKGLRKRKSVTGREIGSSIAQINLKIIKAGPKSIEENYGIEPKVTEEKPVQAEE
ncbi:MAG: 30S ribosomal protein S6e [Nanoarchaeota archaeon]